MMILCMFSVFVDQIIKIFDPLDKNVRAVQLAINI